MIVPTKPQLVEIFALDNAEQTLFRSYSELISEAGCWASYLSQMLTFHIGNHNGACGGLEWSVNVFAKHIKFKGMILRDRIFRRTTVFQKNNDGGSSQLQISLEPYVYNKGAVNEYADFRFSVKSNNETIPVVAILFFDQFFQNYS